MKSTTRSKTSRRLVEFKGQIGCQFNYSEFPKGKQFDQYALWTSLASAQRPVNRTLA